MKRLLAFIIVLSAVQVVLSPAQAGPFQKAKADDKDAEQAEVFVYEDHGRRDPFWPLVTPSGSIITHEQDLTIADLILEGIMTENDKNNIAIINGRILNKEDAIGSFVIKDITNDTVILQKGKKIFTLKLKKED